MKPFHYAKHRHRRIALKITVSVLLIGLVTGFSSCMIAMSAHFWMHLVGILYVTMASWTLIIAQTLSTGFMLANFVTQVYVSHCVIQVYVIPSLAKDSYIKFYQSVNQSLSDNESISDSVMSVHLQLSVKIVRKLRKLEASQCGNQATDRKQVSRADIAAQLMYGTGMKLICIRPL